MILYMAPSSADLSPSAAAFVEGAPQLLVAGERPAATDGRTFATLDPSTGEEICQVPLAGPADVDAAVTAAREALDGPWGEMSPADRGALLVDLARRMTADAGVLAELESLDNGKPIRFARAIDVPAAVSWFSYYAGWPTKIEGETIPVSVPGEFVYTRHEPVGVCGQIIPWNFPLLTLAQKVAPALAGGNAVVLKPAEQTPLTALRFAELVAAAGFPPGVVNIVTGPGETGAALVAHADVDKIAFTGSTAVGREVAALAGRSLKRTTLELGGKNPTIILEDADLKEAVRGSFFSAYHNSGQVCQAASRLYVHRSQLDEVAQLLADRAASIRLGPGLDQSTQLGPLVSEDQLERVRRHVRDAVGQGAELVTGGNEPLDGPSPGGYFMSPTLLLASDDELPVVREEIFGPVLVAMAYDDLDEVAARANASDYGLAAYIWTQNLASAHRLAARLRAGSVFINSPTLGDPAAPFGGFKSSGIGREGGRANLDGYLERKTVWTRIG
jgi:aldehyde dehydrogenase (NAD+)/phenylacetaldehyde dehydrogenase